MRQDEKLVTRNSCDNESLQGKGDISDKSRKKAGNSIQYPSIRTENILMFIKTKTKLNSGSAIPVSSGSVGFVKHLKLCNVIFDKYLKEQIPIELTILLSCGN